jgi:hypothetical protein
MPQIFGPCRISPFEKLPDPIELVRVQINYSNNIEFFFETRRVVEIFRPGAYGGQKETHSGA